MLLLAESACFIREQVHGGLNCKFVLLKVDKFDPNLTFPVTQIKAVETSHASVVNISAWRPLLTIEMLKLY